MKTGNEKFEINPEITESIAAEDDFELPVIEGPTPAVRYFVDKFEMKMSGSVPSVAAWWIDGIGEITAAEKRGIWVRIQGSLDLLARDRGAEHEDFPTWIN